MTPHDCPSGVIDISVCIEWNARKLKYVWYYNGMSAKNFSIRVPASVGRIRFVFDKVTEGNFKFTKPGIVGLPKSNPFPDATAISPDIEDGIITFYNTQQNCGYVKVAAITLNAELIASNGEVRLSSDPEMTNTGGEAVPPSCGH
ncbi:hypothetical protein [Nitrospirillum viridazoti]|uniref:hypothetical protein n=1 Tax=Nitrospirillum viridazoti TaxID=3144925 RepID=UPI0011A32232|nr:hypothetical protein [Nitrospirillum amazonense]